MKITFVQHGDYREAALRLAAGGEETYYAQRYSVELVANLAQSADDVSVVCVAAKPYDERLPSGVRAVGMPLAPGDVAPLLPWLDAHRPTHLVARTPAAPLLRWALRARVRLLPLLADSFGRTGLRGRLGHWQLRRLLARAEVEWIGNHNFNASLDLVRIGVAPGKVVPWDWPAVVSPHGFPAKVAPQSSTLLYVGALSEAKGLGDVLDALALLQREGLPARLTVIGGGDPAPFSERARDLGVEGSVDFLGRIGHARVIEEMREHDVVIVPSRHSYPEGLPMTIYDALSARTPLVLSDHPMFAGKVEDGVSGLVFRAGAPEDLARRIRELISDAGLYARLSERALEAWERIRAPTLWGDLVERWLRDSNDDRRWLAARTLAALRPPGGDPGGTGPSGTPAAPGADRGTGAAG